MGIVRSFLQAALILLLSSVTAVAHHSAAAYDVNSIVRIDGTVTRYDWGNPHVYIEIEGIASGGSEARTWLVELAHPATVSLLGLEPSSLRAGDEISILANPPRNPARAIASFVSLEAEAEVESAIDIRNIGQAYQAIASRLGSEATTSLEGVWVPAPGAWQESGFGDISDLQLTDAAQAAAREFDPSSTSIGMECLPEPIPSGMLSPSAPSFLSFEIEADSVTLRGGSDAMVRTVWLDGSGRPAGLLSPYGNSIGRWDGDVLVLETFGFEPHPQGIAPGVPSSTQKRLIERFELGPDGTSLSYSFELSDPESLTEAISATVEWLYLPDTAIDPVPCTLENARRFLAE